MKSASSGMQSHLSGEVTTLATCWKLTRKDSTVLGFCDHDKDVVVGGVTYQAETGFTPTVMASSAALNVDNLDVEGMLSSGSITEADIMAGKYDFAEIEIFKVNYQDLSQGVLKLSRGWLGEVSLKGQQFVAEVRGLTQRLAQRTGELYSPSCRATLGDARCGVNLALHTVTGTVTTGVSRYEIVDSARSEASGIFSGGLIMFNSGANAGLKMEVKEHTYTPTVGGRLVFVLPLPYAIAAGNSYSLSKGCDKTLGTCKQRFNNILNFRGEPHVPGLDRMMETAGTRSVW